MALKVGPPEKPSDCQGAISKTAGTSQVHRLSVCTLSLESSETKIRLKTKTKKNTKKTANKLLPVRIEPRTSYLIIIQILY